MRDDLAILERQNAEYPARERRDHHGYCHAELRDLGSR
jgi:hypothetical protein